MAVLYDLSAIYLYFCVYHTGLILNIVQNDDDDDARRYGSLVMPRHYIINDDLQRHFSSIFFFMTPHLGLDVES